MSVTRTDASKCFETAACSCRMTRRCRRFFPDHWQIAQQEPNVNTLVTPSLGLATCFDDGPADVARVTGESTPPPAGATGRKAG
jgi:hypothetical protein